MSGAERAARVVGGKGRLIFLYPDEGDGNRILNSDPVLWAFAGDVDGLTVLDAGCGTGYLSKMMCQHFSGQKISLVFKVCS